MSEFTLPWRVAKIKDVPEPARPFYRRGDDGHLELQLAEDHPDTIALRQTEQKLAEFRDNNRGLNAAKTELETKLRSAEERLAALDGADPGTAKAAVEKLTAAEARAVELQQALGRTKFEHEVTRAFLAAGGREDAVGFMTTEAAKSFEVTPDGTVRATATSAVHPGQPLTMGEWVQTQMTTAGFAFKPSKGSGAIAPGAPRPRPTISKHDPVSFGKNVEKIARGELGVE